MPMNVNKKNNTGVSTMVGSENAGSLFGPPKIDSERERRMQQRNTPAALAASDVEGNHNTMAALAEGESLPLPYPPPQGMVLVLPSTLAKKNEKLPPKKKEKVIQKKSLARQKNIPLRLTKRRAKERAIQMTKVSAQASPCNSTKAKVSGSDGKIDEEAWAVKAKTKVSGKNGKNDEEAVANGKVSAQSEVAEEKELTAFQDECRCGAGLAPAINASFLSTFLFCKFCLTNY